MLLSVLMAIGTRLATFRDRRPDMGQELAPLLRRVADWLGGGGASDPGELTALRAAIADQVPADAAVRGDADRLLFRTLVHRLDDLVTLWAGLGELRYGLTTGSQAAGRVEPLARHRDHLSGRRHRRQCLPDHPALCWRSGSPPLGRKAPPPP